MIIEEEIQTTKMNSHKRAIVNVIYTANYLTEEITSVLKTFDLSLQQFNVLRILQGNKDKPANLSFIQDRMITKMSNTSRLVDKLIQKGLVSRSICKDNRRKVDIFITDQGKELLRNLNNIIEKKEFALTSNLTYEQLDFLNDLLNQIRE
jgi:DNA-binding MarR family transcriptional regulator